MVWAAAVSWQEMRSPGLSSRVRFFLWNTATDSVVFSRRLIGSNWLTLSYLEAVGIGGVMGPLWVGVGRGRC